MNPFDVDRPAADQWIADKRFMLFGEGGYCPAPDPRSCQWGGEYHPPPAFVEATKRRLRVTVPASNHDGDWFACPKCTNGRITVAHAVVEFGPLVVETPETYSGATTALIAEADALYLRTGPIGDGTYEPVTPPLDVDPASLVGQWAIGGRIEVAS